MQTLPNDHCGTPPNDTWQITGIQFNKTEIFRDYVKIGDIIEVKGNTVEYRNISDNKFINGTISEITLIADGPSLESIWDSINQ